MHKRHEGKPIPWKYPTYGKDTKKQGASDPLSEITQEQWAEAAKFGNWLESERDKWLRNRRDSDKTLVTVEKKRRYTKIK